MVLMELRKHMYLLGKIGKICITFMMTINNFLRGLLLASLLICFNIKLGLAQANKNNHDHYLSIEVRPSFYQPLKIKQSNGKRFLKSNITIGGSAGLKFTKHINEKISASFGIFIEEIPHNLKFEFRDSVSDLLLPYIVSFSDDGKFLYNLKHTVYDQLSYNLEASVQLLLKQTRSNLFFLELAPKAMYINNSIFSVQLTNSFSAFPDFPGAQVFYAIIEDTSTNGKAYRWLPGISTAVGITRYLSKNRLQLKCFINYVPKLISTGTFNFYELKNENNGTLKHRINNAGFSISFGIPTKK